jgi:hypothetical protein
MQWLDEFEIVGVQEDASTIKADEGCHRTLDSKSIVNVTRAICSILELLSQYPPFLF